MSPIIAFSIVTWAAIAVLFFGLAAVLREVRLLRGIVTRNPDGFTTAQPHLSLGDRFATGDGRQIVLAADSGCPLCLAIADRLAARAAVERPGPPDEAARSAPFEATLLTHEPSTRWDGFADRLRIVSDRESWRTISHLSPPVLMLVDGSGAVRKMSLPVRAEEADGVLREWNGLVE